MVPSPRRRVTWSRLAPIVLSILSLVTAVVVLALACIHDGRLVLPLDDAYIHLAVAKHLVQDGTWGVTAAGFTASVSSIAWPLVIAGIFLATGPSVVVPVVVNLACGVAVLILADAAMRRFDIGVRARALALQAVVFCTPLPTIVVAGMEHSLQILVVLAFVLHFSRMLPTAESTARTAIAAGLACAATVVRYDGVLVVAVGVLALFALRRRRAALWVAAGGLLPIALFAIVSTAHGWPPVPNSVLIRLPLMSEPRTLFRGFVHFAGYRGLRTLAHSPSLAALMIAAAASMAIRWTGGFHRWDERQWLLGIFAATVALHVQYARTGWFFRYEGYLVTVGLVALAAACRDVAKLTSTRIVAVAAAIVLAALASRAVMAMRTTPAWSAEQFDTRHQAAQFLARYYDREVVEIGDIGEACYSTNIRLVDVNGLGSLDLLPSILATSENSPALEDERRAASNADLVVSNLAGEAPAGWAFVGCWTMPDEVPECSDSVYQFYARRGADAARLAAALRAFAGTGRPRLSLFISAQ